MRRAVALAALVLAALVSVSVLTAATSAPSFAYGVAAGEVTSNSAIVWTHAPAAGPVVLTVFDGETKQLLVRRTLTARAADDLTVRSVVRGLRPGRGYTYSFSQGRVTSPGGQLVTAWARATNGVVRFAISGDADATPGPNGAPAFNRFQVYARMAEEGNSFNINLGDTIYSDSEVGGAKPALTVKEKWAKYRLGLALAPLRTLRQSAALYSHWDDHEFINDFTRAENGAAVYAAGVKAFRDYAPVAAPSPSLGLYRTVRWGKHLELFFLDERSFRSAKASAGGACSAPGGAPDLAPTAPQAVRDAFAALAPPLKNPVPPGCLAVIRDPARTMLGAAQYAAFTKAIARSTATWKVIVNEVPIQQFYALPYDRWEGYEAERLRLLRFLQANVTNAVFLTTDTHANFIGEVRLDTLPTPVGTGIWEAITGPVATNTYAKEIDSYLGAPGTAALVAQLFLKPPPPGGIGMSCVGIDTYSYAQVTVTARTLTVRPKDANGKAVKEASGATCAPLVITAR